jgi:hypothetical protein
LVRPECPAPRLCMLAAHMGDAHVGSLGHIRHSGEHAAALRSGFVTDEM